MFLVFMHVGNISLLLSEQLVVFMMSCKHDENGQVCSVTLSSLTLEVEKGNFDGSVLQGVWMAVSGGGQTWVISCGRKKNPDQQCLETRDEASMWIVSHSTKASFTHCIYMRLPSEALQSNCIYTFTLMHLQCDRTETLTHYVRRSVNRNISILTHF